MKKVFIFSLPIIFFGIGISILQNQKTDTIIDFRIDNEIEAFFSPEDKIKEKIINLIRNEKKAIFCAAFRLTEKNIALELISALKRGVKITIIVDSEGFSGSYSKVIYLFNEGIPIYIYPPIDRLDLYNDEKKDEERKDKPLSLKNALMHNKFFIFESQGVLLTGSYNYTRAAEEINQENILILKNKRILNKYKNYFIELSKKSTKLNFKSSEA